jgi:phosphate transport system substrate-binding protein
VGIGVVKISRTSGDASAPATIASPPVHHRVAHPRLRRGDHGLDPPTPTGEEQDSMKIRKRLARLGVFALALTLAGGVTAVAAATAKKAPRLSGSIAADGSSTVGPWTTAAAEMYRKVQPNVRITVGISGTGGGFDRFCRGEIDLANASRPIRTAEYARCQQEGIKWVAFTVANDGISLVASRQNTWADCLTTAELRKIWDRGSDVDNWNDVRAGFPDVPLRLFGPGTDSGTFEFFTEKINGTARRSRSDYSASEDDNILVQGVSGNRGGLGYFGLSYYLENQSRLKLIGVDSGGGCTRPSIKTVQAKTYKPLSRALYIYAKRDSFRTAAVRSFIGFAMNNQAKIAKAADFVALTPQQAKRARYHYSAVLKQVK